MQIFFVFFFTFLRYSTNSQCLSSKTRRRLSKPLRQKRAYSHTGGLGSEPRIAEGRGTIAVGKGEGYLIVAKIALWPYQRAKIIEPCSVLGEKLLFLRLAVRYHLAL